MANHWNYKLHKYWENDYGDAGPGSTLLEKKLLMRFIVLTG
jgi:hypothetical protein